VDLGVFLQLGHGCFPCCYRFLVAFLQVSRSGCLGMSQAVKRMRIYGIPTKPNAILLRDIRMKSHLEPNCEEEINCSTSNLVVDRACIPPYVALRLSFRLLASAVHMWLTHGFASEQDSRTVPWDH
jgi:hypothetical protein